MKKILITIVATVLVCACIVGGTMAWLMDETDPVTNTFTVGNIDITLTESDDLDLKMIPGKVIAKDPTIKVLAGSEPCYVFVEITKSNNFDSFFDAAALSTMLADNGWTQIGTSNVYYYESVVDASNGDETVNVITNVKVLDTVNKAALDDIENGTATAPTLAFVAYAIQQSGFDNAAAAWAELNP